MPVKRHIDDDEQITPLTYKPLVNLMPVAAPAEKVSGCNRKLFQNSAGDYYLRSREDGFERWARVDVLIRPEYGIRYKRRSPRRLGNISDTDRCSYLGDIADASAAALSLVDDAVPRGLLTEDQTTRMKEFLRQVIMETHLIEAELHPVYETTLTTWSSPNKGTPQTKHIQA